MDIPDKFPAIEAVFVDYIRSQVAKGLPWYLTNDVNSQTFPQTMWNPENFALGETTINSSGTASDTTGGNFWADVWHAVGTVAAGVGHVVASTLPVLAQIQGQSAAMRQQYLAGQVQQQTGLNSQLTNAATAAARTDLGIGLSLPMLLLLGGGLALLFLAKRS